MSERLSIRRNAGFTLTEFVIVMVIVAILAAIAIPSYKYVTTSNRMSAEVNLLLGDMQFARSEAIKQGMPITICIANSTGTGCLGSGTIAWQNGWIVFTDTNSNQTLNTAAGEVVLRWQPAFTSTDTFRSSSNALWYLTFNRSGYAPTNLPTPAYISLHDSTGNTQWTRCLAVTVIGSPSTEKYNAGSPACT
jgi:type IV fimbrial biogenesis protein FimT